MLPLTDAGDLTNAEADYSKWKLIGGRERADMPWEKQVSLRKEGL